MRQFLKRYLHRFPLLYGFAVFCRNMYEEFRDKSLNAVLLGIPARQRRLFAQLLSFRISEVADMFQLIPDHQLQRTILFLSLHSHVRMLRMAEAALLAGWHPILIHLDKPKFEVAKYFEYHIQVRNRYQLLLASWLFRGLLVHLFVWTGDVAFQFCVAKYRPIILDLYDTCSGFVSFASITPAQKRREQEAIRLTSGITSRDLRVQHLRKLYNYQLPQHNILVIDPLPTESILQTECEHHGEIHIICSGWIGGANNPESSILRTATALCEAGIYVHVLLHAQDRGESEFEGYWKLAQRSGYFHFEEPIYSDDYWKYLSQCDFGLVVYEPDLFGEPTTAYTADCLQGCGSSRLMDYIRMNLGVIISPSLRFQYWLARRYAPVIVPATPEFLQSPRPILEDAMRRKAEVGTKNLSAITTKGVAQRLGKFYEKVAYAQQ